MGAAVGTWRWRAQDETESYAATCRIEVTADPAEGMGDRLGLVRRELADEERERLTTTLRSGPFQEKCRDKLCKEWTSKVPGGVLDAKVSATPARGSEHMLDLRVDASDGDYALAFLKQLYAEYAEDRKQRTEDRQTRATASLELERNSLQGQLAEARAELLAFQVKEKAHLTEAKATFDEQFLAGLVQRENAVRMERTMIEGQLAVLEDASAATINELVDLNSETHQLTLVKMGVEPLQGAGVDAASTVLAEADSTAAREEELANLEAEYADRLRVYKPAHPKMMELTAKMERAERALHISKSVAEERLRARYQALAIQGQSLADAAAEWKVDTTFSAAQSVTYETLKTTVAHLKERYDQVYKLILDTKVAQGDTVFLSIAEAPAILGRSPAASFHVLIFAIGVSLVAGAGLALLLGRFDTSLRDLDAVEQRLGFTYLHGIPHWGQVLRCFNRRKDVVVVSRSRQNPATEVCRNLRGVVEGAIGESGCYALLITSAQAGEGKSMTAANLAVTFAWTARRVLLVDGDLRRGSLCKAMSLPERKGLTDILSGDPADWRTVVESTEHPNLAFLAAGAYRRDAPELLRPARVRDLLNEFRAAYDVIIVDSPPIGRVVEAEVFSRLCDGVLLVTRFGKTRYADVRHASRHLKGANVLGLCVNAVHLGRKRHGTVYSGECYDPKAYERDKGDKRSRSSAPQPGTVTPGA